MVRNPLELHSSSQFLIFTASHFWLKLDMMILGRREFLWPLRKTDFPVCKHFSALMEACKFYLAYFIPSLFIPFLSLISFPLNISRDSVDLTWHSLPLILLTYIQSSLLSKSGPRVVNQFLAEHPLWRRALKTEFRNEEIRNIETYLEIILNFIELYQQVNSSVF